MKPVSTLAAAAFAALSAAFVPLLLAQKSGAQALEVPADKNPSIVQTGAYVIEPVHTRVLFRVAHMGFTNWYGDFTGASGTLSFDPKHLSQAQLDVSLPVSSVTTTNSKLDTELKSSDWLDTGRFPTARFVSTRIAPDDKNGAEVTGDLTLHGVTQPVTFHVTFNGAGVNPLDKSYTAGFEIKGVIHRSAFGITKYVPLIGDDVELLISAAFVRKS